MNRRSRIIGCGSYLPAARVTNEDLVARGVDTSDDWITQRTGIKSRHFAADGEMTSDLAVAAAKAALASAGLTPNCIDAVILATTTPDNTFPATATKVQAALGMTRGFAFDIQAVCAGFIFALSTADNFIRARAANRVLVIGAETFSRLLDWEDRATCVLFGDGAGAVVLEATEATGADKESLILSTHLHSDGRQYELLYVDGGPSSTGTTGHVRMQGQEVFRHAVTRLAGVVEEALEANGLAPSAIDWMAPHQANMRIIDGIAKKLKLSPDKVIKTVERHGNTSAASIPLALADAVGDGRIKRGDLILMEAIGGGLSWGGALVRW
ncbi:MAG TPA: beta-ketoacyl-ACP synthase III [Azospirillaceae bacterium]|nr:beta-ketoacyl-ACP synthase III [Azospirillaceae bacterium]HRQ81758.1 beta-ketoacyl-ACP synthase III [Azospirillaceae bacterium]